MPLSFTPIPLSPSPVWKKMNYASFLYPFFHLCPFLFSSLSGLMENADYAGFLYANFRAPKLLDLLPSYY
jgi:hypothetical protein